MRLASLINRGFIAIAFVIAIMGILSLASPAKPDRNRGNQSGNDQHRGHRGHHHHNLERSGYKTLVFDVAIDGSTFSPVGLQNVAAEGEEPNLVPVRGTTFIVDGLILPGGTLPEGDGVVVLDDYVDETIGTWLCRGNFVHSLPDILTEHAFPHAATTTQFFFGENGIVSDEELITEGNEGGTTTHRVVTGGTGKYRGMSGAVTQEPLGVNDTGFYSYRFTFKIKK